MLLDGGMGTMIIKQKLTEETFRGTMFRDWKVQLKGNNDVLVLTRPDIIKDIHKQYLAAGSDIVCTNSFSSQRISQEEYLLTDYVEQLNRAAVRIAKEARTEVLQQEKADGKPVRDIFILGDVGPSSRMLSMSDDVNNPASRSITFDEMETAFIEQISILIDEGVDGIMLETCFDTLNIKAEISAYQKVLSMKGIASNDVPLFISFTISDASGRTLSGQTVEALMTSIAHAHPLVVGMNCGLGAEAMVPYMRRLKAPHTSCHPNAGLPNQFGEYDDTPEDMVRQMRPMVEEGLVDIIGGCCGTTPDHIRQLKQLVTHTPSTAPQSSCDAVSTPHTPSTVRQSSCDAVSTASLTPSPLTLNLSGLEAYTYTKDDFIVVGERCNVAGSRKFLRLINEKKYDEALDIARTQVEKGAMVIDVNMDDGLLDAKEEMTTFLNLLMSDPSVCRVPVMVDSSRFDVIEAGLKCCQGKCIVNSISLKQGEEEFLHAARIVKRLGAAVIVMLFDEQGQANDYERRIAIAHRAYRLLTEKVGISPDDIIFDPNVLTIATGMAEHANYARDFIRATEWITHNLPGARISGGLSNLSFAFRGNNYLRECMHSVFLHHATAVGMNMAIMNPATAVKYESIPEYLRDAIAAVILNTSDDASERLTEIAADLLAQQQAEKEAKAAAKQSAATSAAPSASATSAAPSAGNASTPDTPEQRLQTSLLKGITTTLETDLRMLLDKGDTPLQIISGPLMDGMNTVGRLFGEGKMFLPQVVKTARTMKKACELLEPFIKNTSASESKNASAGTILVATVKGDVHDIGKNIVGVVLGCNGFNVIDLGVMVPKDTIVEAAINNKVDIVCLSGLITPSLEEMCHIAEAMHKAGLRIPIFVGGATTSEVHTAVKIAPLYAGPVFHMRDASQNPVVAMQLLDEAQREDVIVSNRNRQQRIRMAHQKKTQQLNMQRSEVYGSAMKEHEAQMQRRFSSDWDTYTPVRPPFLGQQAERRIAVSDIIGCIDWLYFYWAWRVKEDSDEGRMLRKDAEDRLQRMAADHSYDVRTLQAFYPARGKADSIELGLTQIPTPRQSALKANGQQREQCLSLCDYVSPKGNDYIGVFATTISETFVRQLEQLKEDGSDDYEMLLLQSIGDRLAEAAAEYLSRELAAGYTSDTDGNRYQWHGIRPAVGYPSLPDQKTIFTLEKLIPYYNIGITLTENGAMYPQASVTGLYIAHPDSQYFSIS